MACYTVASPERRGAKAPNPSELGRSVFLITHLLRFSVRHPRLVVTLAGVITVCALVFIPRIQLRLDGRSLIPSNLPQFAEGDQAASRFELRDLVLIGVGNENQAFTRPRHSSASPA